MTEQNSEPEKHEDQPRFNQEQYDFLKSCSEKGEEGIKEWNQWRAKKENRHKDILLEGAPLGEFYLKNIDLGRKGVYIGEGSDKKRPSEVFLKKAYLKWAKLQGATLTGTHLEGTEMGFARLEGAYLNEADMQNAEVINANLKGANLREASLKSAHFIGAIVDGNTNMWKVKVDQFRTSTAKCRLYTDFSGVPLQSVIIDPATKQLIEYNIRRKYWYKWITQKNWYEAFPEGNHPIKRNVISRYFLSLIHLFFWMSDYGLRTWRIIGMFFWLALFFAAIYSNMACWFPPGIVSNFEIEPHLPLWHYGILVFLRPIYFSVVTMTTLGFGDMYANAQSIWGHILLTIQVILGYVLLGALVTRFAVLFTAGGPAGKFADEKTI